ncbi:MAG TPA: ATP-binding protein [Verrucomicrobiae bacterium]|nr:ATP-binding protein [Verrucomicrobiae bacterium]
MDRSNLGAGPADSTGDGVKPEGRNAFKRYAMALVSVLAAFAVRYWLTPLLGEELPFMLFIAAALVTAWYGGAVTGMIALLLGLLLASFFFLPARPASASRVSLETLQFIRYCFTAAVGIGLIEVLHRDQRRTQEAADELRREVARRERSEEALQRAQAQLRQHATQLEQRVSERTTDLLATVESLKELLYHIAHNLRAPLRAMEGYSQMLITDYGSKLDATAREYSQHISEASRRMDELIQDLLAYGRLGHLKPELSRVSLQEAVESARFQLGYQIRQREAEVTILEPVPEVLANAQVLTAALIHLLENAIQFTSPGTLPRVTVRAEPKGSRVRLWIEDNGIGIEPRYHERIFTPFETLSPARERRGTGIGLAIVRHGLHRMGGEVGVESQLGQGSRFWIELQRASSDLSGA